METFDLDCQDLDTGHLGVEERHHPREGIGNVVRYEKEPQTLRGKVRGHVPPEAVNIRFAIGFKQCRELV